jgi:hypothetical protein
MKSNTRYSFHSLEEALHVSKLAFAEEDTKLAIDAHEYLFSHLSPGAAKRVIRRCLSEMTYEDAFLLWSWYVEGHLDMSDVPGIRAAYLVLTDYILDNAPPETQKRLDKALHKFFPGLLELTPVGCADDGTAYFSYSEICEKLGFDPGEDTLEYMKEKGQVISPEDLHQLN